MSMQKYIQYNGWIGLWLLALSLLACEASNDFKQLEEKALLKEAAKSESLPVLTGINPQNVYAGSLFQLDMNNEKTGDDAGMKYTCNFRTDLTREIQPCLSLPALQPSSFANDTGVLLWLPGEEHRGAYDLFISGTNESGTDSRQTTLTVVQDTRPTLTPIPAQIVERGQQLLIDVNNERLGSDQGMTYQCLFDKIQDGKVATDGEACEALPGEPAIKFASLSGILAWKPGPDAGEAYEIKVSGRNDTGESELIFAVTVIEPRGDVLKLTSLRDQYISQPTNIFLDVDNELTEDDSGVTYTCRFDRALDAKVAADAAACSTLTGLIQGAFDTRKGVFTWQPVVDGEDTEIIIRGEKNGAVDEVLFVVIFGGGTFGEIGNSALEFTPASFDFGNVQVGTESTVEQIVVKNISAVDVFLQIPAAGNESFAVTYSTCPVTPGIFAPQATCIVGVKFQPNVPAGLGTTVTMNFGSSTADTLAFSSNFALSGIGAGALVFEGLQTITDVTHNGLRLNWDPTSDAITYIVFRVNGTALEFVETIMNIGGNVSGASYDGLTPGTSYTYRVRATDVFGVHDGNNTDVTASTLPNTSPNLKPITAPSIYAGWLVTTVNGEDASTNLDLDADGDNIIYTCRFDNTIDGAVASNAALCATIVGEDGSNVAFNVFSGEMSGWVPKFSDEGVAFEFRILGTDPYAGSSNKIFSGTVQDGDPVINSLSDLLLPAQALSVGDVVSFNLNNERFAPAKDQFMTYSCGFVQLLPSGPSASALCTTLPGSAASFSTSTGAFSWTTTTASYGTFELTFSGTNTSGTDTQIVRYAVVPDYDQTDLVLDFQVDHATGSGPGFNGASFVDEWVDLVSESPIGQLTNFADGAWGGLGTTASPFRLQFDGSNDHVVVSEDLSGLSDFMVEAWVYPQSMNQQVIFSNGDDQTKGVTLGNGRVTTGAAFSPYVSAVLADNPTIYWRFDEISGTNLPNNLGSDSSLNGTITAGGSGGVQSSSPLADFGDVSYRTDAAGRITLGNPVLGANWTIETWFQYPFPGNCSNATEGCTLVRSTINDRPVMVNNLLQLGGRRNAAPAGFLSTGFLMSTLSAGWHHLAAVASGGTTTYYIDGVQAGSPLAWASTSNINTVGNRDTTTGWFGYFDEFAYYTTALTPARILAHYQAGIKQDSCSYLLPRDYWHQVSAIMDTTGSKIRAFVNGQLLCETPLVKTPGVAGTSSDVHFGKSSVKDAAIFQGQMSEVRVYDRVDTAVLSSNFSAKQSRYSPVVPVPLLGLQLWLVAGQKNYTDVGGTTLAVNSGDSVRRWVDLSGRGGDLTPTNLAPVLRKGVINGYDAVEFSGATGVNSTRLRNTINYPRPTTVLYLARILGAPQGRVLAGSVNNWLLGFHSAGRNRFHPTTWMLNGAGAVVNNQWETYVGEIDSVGASRFFVNTSLAATVSNAAFAGVNGLLLGAHSDGSEASYAQVAEVLIYDRVITQTEREQVLQHFFDKYGE